MSKMLTHFIKLYLHRNNHKQHKPYIMLSAKNMWTFYNETGGRLINMLSVLLTDKKGDIIHKKETLPLAHLTCIAWSHQTWACLPFQQPTLRGSHTCDGTSGPGDPSVPVWRQLSSAMWFTTYRYLAHTNILDKAE